MQNNWPCILHDLSSRFLNLEDSIRTKTSRFKSNGCFYILSTLQMIQIKQASNLEA